MNLLKTLLLTSDSVAGPTPPTINETPPAFYILIVLFALLLVIIFILSLIINDKNKLIKSLQKKCLPTIYTNNDTKDIIIISNDDYETINVSFSIYDENSNLIKTFTIQENNFNKDEQRIIANISEYNEYKIKYEIIDCKEKV